MGRFARIVLYFTIFLFLSGGIYFHGNGKSFEISQVNIFGAFLLLTFIFLREGRAPFDEALMKVLRWGEDLSVRHKKLAFFLFFGTLFIDHVVRHLLFRTHICDMAFEHQALFYPFGPDGLLHCDICLMKTAFGEHEQWTYLPFSVLTAPFKSDIWVFALQQIVVAFPLWFFITRGPLRDRPKNQFWFFILFVFMASFRSGLLWDFREDLLALAGILLGFTFLFQNLLFWSGLCFVFALWSKENIPYLIAILAIVLFFKKIKDLDFKRLRIFAAILFVLSVMTNFVETRYLIPLLQGSGESNNVVLIYFPGMGSTMRDFFINVVSHPINFIARFGVNMLTTRSILYLCGVFAPWIILGRRGWPWILPACFTAILNTLTVRLNQNSGSYHYELVVAPFLMWSVALSVREEGIQDSPKLRKKWILALLVALCLAERGPVFETTDRLLTIPLAHIGDAIKIQSWSVETEPLAASFYILTHFQRIEHIRTFLPSLAVSEDSDEVVIQKVLDANPTLTPTERLGDIDDVRTFVLDLDEPNEKRFAQTLLKDGAKLKNQTRSEHGLTGGGLAMLEINEPFKLWACHHLNTDWSKCAAR